jgi:AAA15 family ATPase/GTPase
MLIDFTVENYRSIKGPVTLSAVAQGRKAGTALKGKGRARIKPDHEIAPGYPVEGWGFELLPVLAIFGANASGKSNVVKALDDFLTFVALGDIRSTDIRDSTNFDKFVPFKLDPESSIAPTRFEVRVFLWGDIYTYTLSLNRTRILSERLEYAKSNSKRNRRLFHRDWSEDTRKFEWKNGEDFKGPHTQLEASLGEREPFLSILGRVKPEWDVSWLRNRFRGVVSVDYATPAAIYLSSEIFEEERKNVIETVQQFDIGIDDISLEKNEDRWHMYAYHNIEKEKIRWPFEEESMGTQRLFDLAFRIHIGLSFGTLTIIDELGSNIHPNITRAIVKMFQNPKTNPRRTQLIFTSHDNTLQRGNLLRRDQIWFTQKRDDQSTELYSLSDFKVRNDLAIDKAYLDGRFGAVPFLPDEEFISLSEG